MVLKARNFLVSSFAHNNPMQLTQSIFAVAVQNLSNALATAQCAIDWGVRHKGGYMDSYRTGRDKKRIKIPHGSTVNAS